MKKWESTLISPDASLQDAIAVLDRGALRIVLVTDTEQKLLGTVTDGDIRRALLKGDPLSTTVDKVMSASPKVAVEGWSKARMLGFMESHDLLQLPIINASGQVIGLETLHGLLLRPRQDNPVFLMAGGFGTRLRPLTNTCPKPMLKVGDKPILEHILEGFVDAGFHRFFISTHYMPELIRSHFGDGSRWNVDIRYIHEEEPLGTGGALGLLPAEEITQPMFMMNGDLLTNLNHLALLAFHEAHGGSATVCVREYEHQIPFGVIKSDGDLALDIIEKPVHRFNVNAGIYLLSPDVIHRVCAGEKVDMPDLLKSCIHSGNSVHLYPIQDYWLDIGRMDDFKRAQLDIAEFLND